MNNFVSLLHTYLKDTFVLFSIFVAIVRESGYSLYSFDDGEDFNSSYPNPQNLIFRHDPLLGCPDSTQTVTVNRLSREIVFYNTRPSNYMTNCLNDSRVKTTVEICEVKVMGKILL